MSKYMKSRYEYSKKRREFGRQPLFQVVPAQILDSIYSNEEEQRRYILRNPVHREVQATMPQSEHDANTKELVIHEQGINHTEGGWPRDVHPYNEDHVTRYRRRVQHEDGYVNTVTSLHPQVEHYIDQNNAIDMYQTYFADMTPQPPVEKYNLQIANAFYDRHSRPVSCIVWTNERPPRLAITYCQKIIGNKSKQLNYFSIWDIQRQTAPLVELLPEYPCWELACSPVKSDILVAGLENGTVNIFDIRKGRDAISKSSIYSSHIGPVSGLLFTHTRTNTEFFTGSLDGFCLWWDTRNLSTPIDRLPMSVRYSPKETPSMSNAEGVSSLQFDRGLPTKFLCGTESGLVINANRMGRSHSEILTSYWEAHTGPVRAIHRSPCTLRMFITCGDWNVRIWSEEVRTAPIIVTKPYRNQVTDVTWTPLRHSSYMSVCEGGYFYYWDILRNFNEAVAALQVSKHSLTKLTPHRKGQMVAIGDTRGTTFLLNLSDNMTYPDERDKQLVHQIYDRETRREHILDARLKEIHLKHRDDLPEIQSAGETITEEGGEHGEEKKSVDDEDYRSTEEEYFRIVKQELKKTENVHQ
ncbi:PREDICTED: dynein intermediate chain 3, ciliary-like [Papilio polytes]|uniref:dynein intermediate chain 3, ciliary-like n=1 Tax=Papilio polytes TaxID=76194 RepID=UPI0006762734|nr:PREDICTED: dynein intermediate chain 3, ciliary-like [Papilio polytes]